MLVSYDIADDKLRTRFSKYLKKYGYRVQYSIFAIKNSTRVLELIKTDIEVKYAKHFKETDSIMILEVDDKKIISYGYTAHEDQDLVIVT